MHAYAAVIRIKGTSRVGMGCASGPMVSLSSSHLAIFGRLRNALLGAS